MRFRDRTEAGRRLARELERFRGDRTVVLGLVRGGVPVAREVARALAAPLATMVVLPLGAPESPDFELGAIAQGGGAYVDPEALLEVGLRDDDVEAIAEREGAELARRVRRYHADPLPALAGATVLVVDEGVATGGTARAAARAARKAGAARVVLAAPVVAADRVPGLRADFDDVVAVEYPDPLLAVGVWYERFPELGDDDVLALLGRGAAPGGGPGVGAGPTRDVTEDTSPGEPPRYPRRE